MEKIELTIYTFLLSVNAHIIHEENAKVLLTDLAHTPSASKTGKASERGDSLQ